MIDISSLPPHRRPLLVHRFDGHITLSHLAPGGVCHRPPAATLCEDNGETVRLLAAAPLMRHAIQEALEWFYDNEIRSPEADKIIDLLEAAAKEAGPP